MLDVLMVIGALLVAFSALVVAGVYLSVRRLRRSAMLRRADLVKQRFLSASLPRREVARLRTRVMRASGGASSIMVLLGDGASSGDLRSLHRRLERLAATVDRQLEVLGHEPDDGVLAAALPAMRRRTEQVVHTATELRGAASLMIEGTTDQELELLRSEARLEVRARRRGEEALRSFGG